MNKTLTTIKTNEKFLKGYKTVSLKNIDIVEIINVIANLVKVEDCPCTKCNNVICRDMLKYESYDKHYTLIEQWSFQPDEFCRPYSKWLIKLRRLYRENYPNNKIYEYKEFNTTYYLVPDWVKVPKRGVIVYDSYLADIVREQKELWG